MPTATTERLQTDWNYLFPIPALTETNLRKNESEKPAPKSWLFQMLLRTKDERIWVFIIVKRVSVIFLFPATGIWISAGSATPI